MAEVETLGILEEIEALVSDKLQVVTAPFLLWLFLLVQYESFIIFARQIYFAYVLDFRFHLFRCIFAQFSLGIVVLQ